MLTGSELSPRHLPLMEIKSINPGPVVWLTSCSHGDEVGGIVVIQEIFKRIRKKPLLKGSIHAFPLMNPMGFENISRSITYSKEDLNRSFPGDKNGSLAERIADKIFTTILNTKPALVLDLHNDWRKSIPYALIDKHPGPKHQEAYESAKRYSKKTGFLVISEQKESVDYDVKDELDRSLSYSLLKEDIPALTLELGESYVVNEKYVAEGVKSVWGILSELGMVEPVAETLECGCPPDLSNKILIYSQQPVSSISGITRFYAEPGQIVKKGQPIAKIYNAFGKLQETLNAQEDAIVLGYSDSSVAFPGFPVMAFGVIK